MVAQVDLAREFVDFSEAHLPMLATSVISIFGAVGMMNLTAKALSADGPVGIADTFLRRNTWLVL